MWFPRWQWRLATFIAAPAASASCPELLDRAQQAFVRSQFPSAESTLKEALRACSDDRVRIYVSLGQVEYLLGKEVEAEKSMLTALGIDSKNEEALYALGRAYSMQSRYPEAVEKFQALLQINPENHRAWDNLGVAYDALNRDNDALKSFFKALDLVMKKHPTYDWAHANLADFFLRRDQNEKAFQLAAEAAKRNPNSPRNCFLTAKALVRLDKHDLSVRWLKRAVELDPDYSEALYVLAQTYRRLGQTKEAADTLARFQQVAKKPARRR
jgi:tetratricopeptide (TPR) repeat protein